MRIMTKADTPATSTTRSGSEARHPSCAVLMTVMYEAARCAAHTIPTPARFCLRNDAKAAIMSIVCSTIKHKQVTADRNTSGMCGHDSENNTDGPDDAARTLPYMMTPCIVPKPTPPASDDVIS